MASKEKHVQIPLGMFEVLLELLNCLEEKVYGDNSNLVFDSETQFNIIYMLENLRHKKDKMNLRKAYANLYFAKNEDEQHKNRIKYLIQKNEVENSLYFNRPY